jgi:hypothetical protein
MALLFPWATKEYLLWEMTIGQILFYNNKAIDIKNGKIEDAPGLANKPTEELRKMRDDYKAQVELENREKTKIELSKKFGEIE